MSLIGLAFWVLGVVLTNPAHIGALGLISIVGWPYFVALFLILVGFATELLRTPLVSWRLVATLVALLVVLYGTASAVFPIAILPDNYLHAGFIQYIFTHGHVKLHYDARFSWPGSFALGALAMSLTGQSTALGFLHWFPLVIELTYLAPLYVIARRTVSNTRTAFLGVAFFYVGNWIFQDYFSPQALNFLFFLVLVAGVLSLWTPLTRASEATKGLAQRFATGRQALTPRRWNGDDAVATYAKPLTALVIVLLMVIVTASAVSHQLTPYIIVLALGGLLLTRRLGRPELLVGAAVMTWAWISLGASGFWANHLSNIFGSFGNVSGSVTANLSGRVHGGAAHLFVVDARIGLLGFFIVLAGIGVLRRSSDDRSLELLAALPYVTMAAQSYGGEALLRAALFSLPFLGVLAANALLPDREGAIAPWWPARSAAVRPAVARAAIVIVLLLSAVFLTIDRGGNDAFDSFTKGELDAVNYVYHHIKNGETFASECAFIPVGQGRFGDIHNLFFSENGQPFPVNAKLLIGSQAAYIMLSQSEERWGVINQGYPAYWQSIVSRTLLANGYVLAAHWPTADIYKLVTPNI